MVVHFLTPCHATPYYSHLHVQQSSKHSDTIKMWFPDCSPTGRQRTAGVPLITSCNWHLLNSVICFTLLGSDSDLLQRYPAQFACLVYRDWLAESEVCQVILNSPTFGLQPARSHNGDLSDAGAAIQEALAQLPLLPRPTHVVLFDSTLEQLQGILRFPALQLEEAASFHHSHFSTDADDPNIERRIHVLGERVSSGGLGGDTKGSSGSDGEL
jgi:hypothetical protein